MSSLTLNPAAFAETFQANFNTRNLDILVNGYAEDAVLDLGGEQSARGHKEIRTVLENFLAAGLPIVVKPHRATVTGDHAIVVFDWSITGAAPDGSPVAMGGTAIDLLRKDANGTWRQLIDLPFGAGTPTN